MPNTITASFNSTHGFVIVETDTSTAGFVLMRRDLSGGPYQHLPGRDAADAVPAGRTVFVDYLVPLGTTVRYVLRDFAGQAQGFGDVTTPTDRAYVRHLYHPSWGVSVRVVDVGNITYPARQTLYSVSGRRFEGATYDVRGGRELTVSLLIIGVTERAALNQILEEGNPVSFAMCSGLGEEAGVFAVGNVTFRRLSGKQRWVVELPLTEVGIPHVIGGADQVAEATQTYDQVAAHNASYGIVAARYATYIDVMADAHS